MKNAKPFSKKIGVVGGGQLGKMLIESGQPWNVRYNVLDKTQSCPSGKYASKFIPGSLTNASDILELASHSDILTYEIEHIDVQTLKKLEENGKEVIPSANVLQVIQNKGTQKSFYKKNDIPTSPFFICQSHEISKTIESIQSDRVVIKSCTGGYDGKGVYIVEKNKFNADQVPFSGECLVEEFAHESNEVSVIVARNRQNQVETYPVCEMVFDQEINLVDYLYAPSNLSEPFAEKIKKIAKQTIHALNGIGVFAVEFFIHEEQDKIWVNEVAPRPHNSGHHTIEACYCSQYEQLNRILLHLPLGSTELIKPAVMVNIIGPTDVSGGYKLIGLTEILNIPGVYFHWYDKEVTKPGRKMGHITVLNDSKEKALEIALSCRNELKIIAQ